MLERDLAVCEDLSPMSHEEVERVHAGAPEYRGYVCRQCEGCESSDGVNLKRIFELEGWYDRQMWDGIMRDPADYSMRVRMGKWFWQVSEARKAYAEEDLAIAPDSDYSALSSACPHIADIDRKLKVAHSKLSSDWILV